MAKAPTTTKKELVQLDPTSLALDLENPRLAQADLEGRIVEKDVIEHLALREDLGELVQSIALNGYLDFEPLVVWMHPKKKVRVVIEGNRRVAAIKLIKAPDLASELGVPVPELANGVLATLEKATIIEVDDRDDARQYIGFKHINGPHKWDSFAKAKFAADWYKAESKDGVTLRDIARKLGDRHDTVLRLVQAIFVIDQAAKKGLFEVEDRYQKKPFAFSHLYTALTRTQYREYLGLPTNWRQVEPTPNPVPADKLKRLEKVLKWLYGSDSDSIPPVVTSQNPHVKQLGEVLANPQGLRKLEQTNDLAKAHAEVDTRSKKFSDNLLKAVEYAQSAQGYIEAYDGEAALVEFGERLARIGKLVHAAMLATAEEVGAKAAERTKSADTRK